jgi:flavorubredoxin
MEPDHCATLGELIRRYPDVKVVGNAKTIGMIKQFYEFDIDARAVVVKENDTLTTGKHTLTFLLAPMVHWPEVMVTYDTTDKILFSADAFGTFGAMNGNLFADEVNFERDWLDDARRYYTNIVGKYGPSVQTLLKKAAALEIAMICPLHGPVWRENISWYVDKYLTWSSYAPEEKAVMIAYGSIYGNTENAANILACKLADKGVKNIAVYDVSATHSSVILSEAFRCSHLVFASATYNGGVFTNMEHLLLDMKAHSLQNRTVAVMENGSWGVLAGKLMKETISGMKNMEILEETVTVKSTLKASQEAELEALADAIVSSMS